MKEKSATSSQLAASGPVHELDTIPSPVLPTAMTIMKRSKNDKENETKPPKKKIKSEQTRKKVNPVTLDTCYNTIEE